MDFVYSQSPWVLPKDPEGTEKIFTEHGWKVTFNDHEVIPFGLEKRVYLRLWHSISRCISGNSRAILNFCLLPKPISF